MLLAAGSLAAAEGTGWFEISVIDSATKRGIPLVELVTVNHLSFCTDSAGSVAVDDPDLLNRVVYFAVHAPGYELPADGYGFRGVVMQVDPGQTGRIELKRLNIAERLYRFTGTGIYNHTVSLGRRAPIAEPLSNGKVAVQDTMSAIAHSGHIFWFGGDTLRLQFPLGQYWTSGATSELPFAGGLDPARGVNLNYLVDADGFTRPMWLRPKDGVIWTDGLMTLKDEFGSEKLVAHYANMKSLTEIVEHGLGVFDERSSQFSFAVKFPVAETWRCPTGHPTPGRDGDDGCYLFSAGAVGLAPFLAVRAKASLAALGQAEGYAAFSYLRPGGNEVERDAAGRVVYDWKPQCVPISPLRERELIRSGALREDEALYQVHDLESGRLVDLREGSVQWNPYRKKWIMIAEEQGAGSFSGEIWYAEAAVAVGPWRTARKIVSHNRQSLYNPSQLPFFDQDGGRIIYFIGTYADTRPGGPEATPRYDGNLLMYRLDLADERLHEPAGWKPPISTESKPSAPVAPPPAR